MKEEILAYLGKLGNNYDRVSFIKELTVDMFNQHQDELIANYSDIVSLKGTTLYNAFIEDLIIGIVYWNVSYEDILNTFNSIIKKNPQIVPLAKNCKDTFELDIAVYEDRTLDYIKVYSSSVEKAKAVKFSLYNGQLLDTFLKDHQWQSPLTLRNKANIGTKILTLPMGNWAGGECIITEIPEQDELEADNIALIINRCSDGDEMGVFVHELVRVIEPAFVA